jgi:GDP-L-fucose synthase
MREFLWSEEMAEACVYVMENINFSTMSVPQPGNEPKPTARNKKHPHQHRYRAEVSIKQVAELIKEKVGFKGELYFNTSKPDGTMKKLTDPSKIHSLGWHHKIEIDQGIERMYNWYTSNQ